MADEAVRRNGPEARLADIRAARRSQGHELTRLQEAVVTVIARSDPAVDPAAKAMIAAIRSQTDATGAWQDYDEWRIGTCFDNRITRSELKGRPWFTITVVCDGQTLSCGCPSVERAFGFMRLYQELIIDQFYSVGPPWADRSLFPP